MYTVFCREDVVADLVEQISELTAIIEQLRRDHQVTHKQASHVGCGENLPRRYFRDSAILGERLLVGRKLIGPLPETNYYQVR